MAEVQPYFFIGGEKQMTHLREMVAHLQIWPPEATILVAVSTGVDSMVLLDILYFLQEQGLNRIGVAHVNHQLRVESAHEAQFLQAYCQERAIPYFQTNWQPTQTAIEANARKFRYQFFQTVMQQHHYDVLVTAHHSDDQMETMLMKLLRDGQLHAVKGIVQSQPFGNHQQLVRPLLKVSKDTVYEYAHAHHVPYFEDATNQSDDYLRNRLRRQALPLFRQENQQVASHFQQVSEQIQTNEQLLVEQVWSQDRQAIQRIQDGQQEGWQITYPFWKELTVSHQAYFMQQGAVEFQKKTTSSISTKQLKQIQRLLQEGPTQWSIDLSDRWQVKRMYQIIAIVRPTWSEPIRGQEVARQLSVNESRFLNDMQWIGLFESSKVQVPAAISDWSEYKLMLPAHTAFPLMIRKRGDGDRLHLTPQLTKRVARWLIDQKIPTIERETGWFVLDNDKNGIGFLPFIHSYLSINEETDKILYVLLYKYRK